MQDKKDAENKALGNDARVAALESENAELIGKLAKTSAQQFGSDMGRMVDPGAMKLVQFARDYSFGGMPAPGGKRYIAAPFSVRSGDVVRVPEIIATRVLAAKVAGTDIVPQKIARRTFDTKRLEWRTTTETIAVDDLKKNAPNVGMPRAR